MQDESGGKQVPIREHALRILSIVHRKFRLFTIAFVTLAVVSAVVSLLIPEIYRAESKILPPEQQSSVAGVAARLNLNIGSLGGDENSFMSTADLYPVILYSRRIIDGILAESYHGKSTRDYLLENVVDEDPDSAKTLKNLRQTVRDMLVIDVDIRTQMITISGLAEDPEFAAALVNTSIAQIREYFRLTMDLSARRKRMQIELRMEQVSDSLRLAEEQLRDFRENNRVVSNSPQLMLEQNRLVREVEIQNAVYVELAKQLELARIEELGSTPVINILDEAEVPVQRVRPKRKQMVLYTVFLGELLLLFFFYARERGWFGARELIQEYLNRVDDDKREYEAEAKSAGSGKK
jgi:uncharacterized protein involved in exopolysaccharide biosynthesis